MMRSRLLIYVAFGVVAILAIVFLAQVKQLRKQIRSTVRIVPGDAKSRENVAQQELEQGPPAVRPDALVKFRSGVSSDAAKQIIARLNHELVDQIEAVPGLVAIAGSESAHTDAMLVFTQYRALPEVEYAEPNYEINPSERTVNSTQSAEPKPNSSWPSKIGLASAWTKTQGSRNIVVAVLDSGIEISHPNLVNNIWTRPTTIGPYCDQELGGVDDVHGYSTFNDHHDLSDENGHGTLTAGIIGSECFNHITVCGVSPTTSIMALKFLNAAGYGTVADAVKAINYAIDRKRAGVNIRIINVGWGLDHPSRPLEDVIRSAGEAGILFVVASGDQTRNNDQKPYYPASYELENIVSVAALGPNDELAAFSNFGFTSVDIAAPGEGLLTTGPDNGYQVGSDTAAAAAVVSGVAALCLAVNPELSVAQLRKLLVESVEKLPGLSGKLATGGRINAAQALQLAPKAGHAR